MKIFLHQYFINDLFKFPLYPTLIAYIPDPLATVSTV